ncbi:response regulator transcription factor [Paenibacillus senegalensis]|uniref:response regulator transcription factor n=1 Tax=Paenibacillus senegalensis TaxID=1465766 RepID=UPI000287F149|nr:response regulator transcription factor [Paenibacillus senegalensis]
MNTPAIQVLLVEDDPDWVDAVRQYLQRESDIEVAGTACSPEEALRLSTRLVFDIALLDIQLTPGKTDGIDLALQLAESHPSAKLIMLTSLSEEQTIQQAFTAGALQYVLKSQFRELPYIIRSSMREGNPLAALLKDYARLKQEEQLQPLTPAEREIIDLIGQGYTRSQIQSKLFKAESTLKNQIHAILKKLGVRSGKEAVDKIRRKGL